MTRSMRLLAFCDDVLKIPAIGLFNPLAQGNPRRPAERLDLVHREQFSRSAVRLGRIEGQLSFVADYLAEQFRQLADRHVFAAADVDDLGRIVSLQQEPARGGQVFDMQEFAARGAGAPYDDFREARLFRFVDFPQEGGEDVRLLEVKVIAGAVEIGRHGADEVPAILAVVRLAEADARDLRDGVGVVRRLQRTGEQRGLRDGLRRVLRVNAGTAQEEQFLHPGLIRGLDEVVLDLQVVQKELDGKVVVRLDAADRRRGDDHQSRLFPLEKAGDGFALRQVQLGVGAGEDFLIPVLPQIADDSAPDETPMPGYKDRFLLHLEKWDYTRTTGFVIH